MSGDRDDIDSGIVLPDGMELVVPPTPNEPADAAGLGAGRSGVSSKPPGTAAERVIFPPFVHRGEVRQAAHV